MYIYYHEIITGTFTVAIMHSMSAKVIKIRQFCQAERQGTLSLAEFSPLPHQLSNRPVHQLHRHIAADYGLACPLGLTLPQSHLPQIIIQPRLPTATGGEVVGHDFRVQADADPLLGWLLLLSPSAIVSLQYMGDNFSRGFGFLEPFRIGFKIIRVFGDLRVYFRIFLRR